MKIYIFLIIFLLIENIPTVEAQSRDNLDIITDTDYYYNLANEYFKNNSISLIIKNNNIIITENISEDDIILFIKLIDSFIVNIFNVRYKEKWLDSDFINNYGVKLANNVYTLEVKLYEQCIIKKIKFPLVIRKNEILPIEYFQRNNILIYIINTDGDIIVSTKNDNSKIMELINYINSSLASIKNKIFIDNETFDYIAILTILNTYIDRLIKYLEIDNFDIPNTIYKIAEDNKIFLENRKNQFNKKGIK
jgi:hypothetical protein